MNCLVKDLPIYSYAPTAVKYQYNWSNIHYESIVYYQSLVITFYSFQARVINSDKLMKIIYFTTQNKYL